MPIKKVLEKSLKQAMARLKARGKDFTPERNKLKGTTKRRSSEPEGAAIAPDTGGSVDVSRKIEKRMREGTEKVTRGKASGDMGIVKESRSKGSTARANRKLALSQTMRDETATPAQRKAAERELEKMYKKDEKDTSRAAKTAAQTRRENAAREARKNKRDPVAAFIQDGEIIGDFSPTPRQIEQALSNLKSRGMSAKAREIEAYKELGPKKFAQQKTKESKPSEGRSKPREFTPRGEELKRGGKVVKRNMGGKVSKPRGCGAALRGYGKAMVKGK
jgi:hypothetical protein